VSEVGSRNNTLLYTLVVFLFYVWIESIELGKSIPTFQNNRLLDGKRIDAVCVIGMCV